MPTQTYRPLATVTLGSSASSVTFSNIPATYRDLILVSNGKSGTGTEVSLLLRPNNDSGNGSRVLMQGDGSSTLSIADSAGIFGGFLPSSSSSNAVDIVNIMDYSATDKHKTILRRGDAPAFTSAHAFRWASTSAITNIVLIVTTQSIGAGSTFSLYGVIA